MSRKKYGIFNKLLNLLENMFSEDLANYRFVIKYGIPKYLSNFSSYIHKIQFIKTKFQSRGTNHQRPKDMKNPHHNQIGQY
jgi:hypothetical protein